MNAWLPLETLPGWPEADPVSNSWMLLLLFGLPLATGVVIALLTFAPTLAKRFRTESGPSLELARRDDQQGPDAHEVVEDARVRHDAVEAGRDENPDNPGKH